MTIIPRMIDLRQTMADRESLSHLPTVHFEVQLDARSNTKQREDFLRAIDHGRPDIACKIFSLM